MNAYTDNITGFDDISTLTSQEIELLEYKDDEFYPLVNILKNKKIETNVLRYRSINSKRVILDSKPYNETEHLILLLS